MEQYITDRYTMEIISIVCPSRERGNVIEALCRDKFLIVSVSPYTDEKMFPNCDLSRTMLRAERRIN